MGVWGYDDVAQYVQATDSIPSSHATQNETVVQRNKAMRLPQTLTNSLETPSLKQSLLFASLADRPG